jgi:hypothetical protein
MTSPTLWPDSCEACPRPVIAGDFRSSTLGTALSRPVLITRGRAPSRLNALAISGLDRSILARLPS